MSRPASVETRLPLLRRSRVVNSLPRSQMVGSKAGREGIMTRRLSIVTWGLLLVIPCRPVTGQSLAPMLAQLQNPIDTARINAWNRLTTFGRINHIAVCSPEAGRDVREGLIAALESEEAWIYAPYAGVRHSEDEVEDYFPDLIGCVAALHDARAVGALIRAIETGGGATNGLVALGNAAVPAVARTLAAATSSASRLSAAQTLGSMSMRRRELSLTDASVAAIRTGLLSALKDSSVWVRQGAVTGLAQFTDTEVRGAMQTLATSDSGVMTRNGKRVFPVREGASAWLVRDSVSRGLRPPPA